LFQILGYPESGDAAIFGLRTPLILFEREIYPAILSSSHVDPKKNWSQLGILQVDLGTDQQYGVKLQNGEVKNYKSSCITKHFE
jgi:hypothetical protein